jgi:hypothetical protein
MRSYVGAMLSGQPDLRARPHQSAPLLVWRAPNPGNCTRPSRDRNGPALGQVDRGTLPIGLRKLKLLEVRGFCDDGRLEHRRNAEAVTDAPEEFPGACTTPFRRGQRRHDRARICMHVVVEMRKLRGCRRRRSFHIELAKRANGLPLREPRYDAILVVRVTAGEDCDFGVELERIETNWGSSSSQWEISSRAT